VSALPYPLVRFRTGLRDAFRDWDAHERTLVRGVPFHAALKGPASAPDVVLVHGLGCSHRYLQPLAAALAPGLRACAVDLPGFGRTPGPRRALGIRGLSTALGEWLRASGRGGAPLVANSMGCQVVADLAVHAPELLGPVVLIGPTMDRHARSPLRHAARLVLDCLREPPSLTPLLVHDYLRAGPRRFALTFAHALADPVERHVTAIPTPAVVVRGSRDAIVSRRWAAELAAAAPDGRLVEVPGQPHALNYAAPEPVVQVLRGLLGEPARSPAP
jgi:pimeloyl-ACP methyl ester carboxylesterase